MAKPLPTEHDKHIGESGKHKGHPLELLEDGRVYCNECQAPLSERSADAAWPPEIYGPEDYGRW